MEYESVLKIMQNQAILNCACIMFIICAVVWLVKQAVIVFWKVIKKEIDELGE